MKINIVYNDDKNFSIDNSNKFNLININKKDCDLFQLIKSIKNIEDNEFYIVIEDFKEFSESLIKNSEEIFNYSNNDLFFFRKTILSSGSDSIDKIFSNTCEFHLPSYVIKGKILKEIQNNLLIYHENNILYQERILTTILRKAYKPKDIIKPLSITFTNINGRFKQITILHVDRNLYILNTYKFLLSMIDKYKLAKIDFSNSIDLMSSQRKKLFNFILFTKTIYYWNFRSALKHIKVTNPIFFYKNYSEENNLEIISFEEFKEKRNNMFIEFSEILARFDIKSFLLGLSALGQIKNGLPIYYDDDIDISVERDKYLENFNEIKLNLEKKNIYLQKWDERNGHNSVIGIDKVFEKKLYHIVDEKFNINSIISPFIDVVTFVNFSPENLLIFEKFEKNMKVLRRFSQNSNIFSTFRSRNLEVNSWVMEKSFKPLSLTPYKFVRNILTKRSNWLLSKVNSDYLNVENNFDVYSTDVDSSKWRITPIEKGNDFLGQNFYQYSDINEVYFRRYGHLPIIYDDSKATPSHLNYESINFSFNKKHWLNTKKIRKEKVFHNEKSK